MTTFVDNGERLIKLVKKISKNTDDRFCNEIQLGLGDTPAIFVFSDGSAEMLEREYRRFHGKAV